MKKAIKLVSLLLVLIFAVSGITGCAQSGGDAPPVPKSAPDPGSSTADEKEPVDGGTITLGFVIPLTGDAAWAGEAIQQIFLYAIEELNEAGGIDGMQVKAQFEYAAATSFKSVTAVEKLINIDNVDAIVGPIFTTCLLAVRDIVNENEVPLIQGTAATPEIFTENGYIFSMDVSNESVVRATAQYLIDQKGFRTIAMLTRYDD